MHKLRCQLFAEYHLQLFEMNENHTQKKYHTFPFKINLPCKILYASDYQKLIIITELTKSLR